MFGYFWHTCSLPANVIAVVNGLWVESSFCTGQSVLTDFLFSVSPSFSGKPLTLNCTARFGYQKNFTPVIKWYIKDSDQEWEFPTSEEIG